MVGKKVSILQRTIPSLKVDVRMENMERQILRKRSIRTDNLKQIRRQSPPIHPQVPHRRIVPKNQHLQLQDLLISDEIHQNLPIQRNKTR